MRPLLIGEAPARTTPNDWPPFYGQKRSGRILWELGFRVTRRGSIQDLAGRAPGNVDAVNLLDEYPGRRWPAVRARAVATEALFGVASTAEPTPASRMLAGRSHVILVGRNVARAFGALECWDFFEWFRLLPCDEPLCAIMPHPSPLNRWWNDPKHMAKARAWSTGFLSKIDPGVLLGFGELRT